MFASLPVPPKSVQVSLKGRPYSDALNLINYGTVSRRRIEAIEVLVGTLYQGLQYRSLLPAHPRDRNVTSRQAYRIGRSSNYERVTVIPLNRVPVVSCSWSIQIVSVHRRQSVAPDPARSKKLASGVITRLARKLLRAVYHTCEIEFGRMLGVRPRRGNGEN